MTHYRAPNEYAWAALLDHLHTPYLYEALEPAIARAIRYRPDFWLMDAEVWLEIKPLGHVPTPGELRVAWQLVDATRCPVYLAAGWPRVDGLRLWVCSRDYPAEQEAAGRQALLWLALRLGRGLPEVLAASKAVMARRKEFIARWEAGQRG
jgi:hypothetical protein